MSAEEAELVKMDGADRSPLWRRLATLVIALFCLWLGGFLYFVQHLPNQVEDTVSVTDAIVVLTGGAERLDAGLRLLIAEKAKRLLVSGVDRATTLQTLESRSPAATAKFACCVDIGHEATDTTGNALEAALWTEKGGYTSLRLVTASYHMPRSLLLFRNNLAGIEVIANPVFPAPVRIDAWWRNPGTAKLLAVEFNKYLFSLVTVRLAAAGGRDARQ